MADAGGSEYGRIVSIGSRYQGGMEYGRVVSVTRHADIVVWWTKVGSSWRNGTSWVKVGATWMRTEKSPKVGGVWE